MLSIRFFFWSLLVGLVLREVVQLAGWSWLSIHAPQVCYNYSLLLAVFLLPFVLVATADIIIALWRVVVGTAKELVKLWNGPLTTWGRLAVVGFITAWIMKEMLVQGGETMIVAWRLSVLEVVLAGAAFLLMAGAARALSDRRDRVLNR